MLKTFSSIKRWLSFRNGGRHRWDEAQSDHSAGQTAEDQLAAGSVREEVYTLTGINLLKR
ncbi:MAG: hypothetical protein EA344_02550 [Alkalicoccus sp.]|nr:MAG: hypothetical protein EA344_02550 [Alkalicoccus sp.]